MPINSGYDSLEASGVALGSGRFRIQFTLTSRSQPGLNRVVNVTLARGEGVTEFQQQTRPAFLEMWQAIGWQIPDAQVDHLLNAVYRNLTLDQFRGPGSGPGPGPAPGVELIRLDPSKFLKFQDRVRFALWKEG